jgi:hypothetical protein
MTGRHVHNQPLQLTLRHTSQLIRNQSVVITLNKPRPDVPYVLHERITARITGIQKV